MIKFSGKTALVTGGTRGIGKSIVRVLEDHGCRVMYTGTRHKAPGRRDANYMQLDLTDNASVGRCIDRLKRVPRIDILVNNAGINIIEPADKITLESWEKVLAVNLTGAMILTREVARIMKRNMRGGKIVNISSILGNISIAGRSAYSASKAGLIGLTRAGALDLAPDNILVNAVCPGFTATDLTASMLSKHQMRSLSREVPLGRFANVSEMANVVAFLCSDMNTYMTGQTVVVDGGFTVR